MTMGRALVWRPEAARDRITRCISEAHDPAPHAQFSHVASCLPSIAEQIRVCHCRGPGVYESG